VTASPESLQQRYEAIEAFYNERQWDAVASLSEALLEELPDNPSHPLRQRLQLLLGHTYCYGYQDGQTATAFYSRVLAASDETMLRQLAEQGLEQCISLADIAAGPAATAATPWMEQFSEGGLTEVEVIEEPELIELAQADPRTAESIELSILPGAAKPRPNPDAGSTPSPEEIAELSKGLLRVVIG